MENLDEKIEILNPEEPKCAVVLLLDVSGSMAGDKIKALNEGVKLLKDELLNDELAKKRVELCLVTFGEIVNAEDYFCSVEDFEPPILEASGNTPMGEAIIKAINLVKKRKSEYKATGVDYYRPWIFLITDGEPTDMDIGDKLWNEVKNKINSGEQKKEFLFFVVGVEPANMEKLRELAPPNRPPLKLKGLAFRELFQWLSKSQSQVSASKTSDKINLPSVDGWAEI